MAVLVFSCSLCGQYQALLYFSRMCSFPETLALKIKTRVWQHKGILLTCSLQCSVTEVCYQELLGTACSRWTPFEGWAL